jgi:REP element-mobilizing transposase RayT
LPNDPRGSSSHEIRVERIAELGALHHGRKEIQPTATELRRFHEKARDVLAHPLLALEDDDFGLVAGAFKRVIAERRYTCYACAIMPDHIHALIRKHRDHAEDMIENLQAASREDLIRHDRRAPTHPVWGGPGWKVFLHTQSDFVRVIDYIRKNPEKIGRPQQHWDFVKPYDGWLPGSRYRNGA